MQQTKTERRTSQVFTFNELTTRSALNISRTMRRIIAVDVY